MVFLLSDEARGESTSEHKMIKLIITAALLAAGTSLAVAQSGQPTGSYPGPAGGANANPARPGINETTSKPSTGHMYNVGSAPPQNVQAPSLRSIKISILKIYAGPVEARPAFC
jgi:hypothetical protein